MPDEDDSPTARLFVAALLPPEIVEALARLPRPARGGVRWTRPEQWHVTLCFLGTAPIGPATTAVQSVESQAVTARLGPAVESLGARLAVVPVDGVDGLAAAVRRATAGVAEGPPEHSFRGHVTLARSRSRIPRQLLGAEIDETFEVSAIHLVRSHLGHSGAKYEVLSARDLCEEAQ